MDDDLAPAPKAQQTSDLPLLPGDGPVIARVQHPVPIVSLAASRDGRLVALGGSGTGTGPSRAADVTVWNLEQGIQISRLAGLDGEVVSLAFSPDGARVAAANEKRMLMAWEIQTGEVVARGEAEGEWKGPAQIVFSADGAARLVRREGSRSYSSDGRFLADIRTASAPLWNHKPYDQGAEVFILDQQDGFEMAALHLLKTEFKTWPRWTAWTPDGWSIVVWSREECGVWQPFEDRFLSQTIPVSRPYQYLYDVAVLPDLTLAYAIQENHLLVISAPGAEHVSSLLTPWERYKRRRDAETPKPVPNPKREWSWGREGFWGEDGVRIEGNHLLWYTHPYNPHAGGGASEQGFEDFLERGPTHELPDEALNELYVAVKAQRA
jgi:hypothetical protein